MPDTITRVEETPVVLDDQKHEIIHGNGWILPAVGAVVLTLLWLAYLVPDLSGILSAVR